MRNKPFVWAFITTSTIITKSSAQVEKVDPTNPYKIDKQDEWNSAPHYKTAVTFNVTNLDFGEFGLGIEKEIGDNFQVELIASTVLPHYKYNSLFHFITLGLDENEEPESASGYSIKANIKINNHTDFGQGKYKGIHYCYRFTDFQYEKVIYHNLAYLQGAQTRVGNSRFYINYNGSAGISLYTEDDTDYNSESEMNLDLVSILNFSVGYKFLNYNND